MEKIKVTIGLCVKNCERTVKETAESIVNQDFPHELLEIIVVDGNSKDKTLSIIKNSLSKTDMPVKMYSDEGKGLGVARSIVDDNASGTYIVQLDGDIMLPRYYVRKQVEFMEQSPNVGMVRGKWKMQKGGNLVAVLESMRVIDYKIRDPRTEATQNLIGNAGSMYRVKALRKIGSWDKHISAGEDIDISARLRAAGWLLSINQEVYHAYRETWKGIWNEYFWCGDGGHYLSHKHKGSTIFWRRFPAVAFVGGILVSFNAYKMTHRKAAFLLPFQRAFKETAWWLGFVKSHIDGHGHFQKQISK